MLRGGCCPGCLFANAAIALKIEGPAEINGNDLFVLVGGVGAVWIRTKEQTGTVKLTATHPRLERQELELDVTPALPEVL